MSSEAAKRATAKYQRDKMESISIRVKRDEGLYNRIKQAATVQGVKPTQFIKQALLNALYNPQPVQATHPQPQTNPATPAAPDIPPDMERISVLSPVDQRVSARIDGAVKYGYGVSRGRYILGAILSQLRQDEATERRKRAQAEQAKLDAYYANMPDNWDDPEPDY